MRWQLLLNELNVASNHRVVFAEFQLFYGRLLVFGRIDAISSASTRFQHNCLSA